MGCCCSKKKPEDDEDEKESDKSPKSPKVKETPLKNAKKETPSKKSRKSWGSHRSIGSTGYVKFDSDSEDSVDHVSSKRSDTPAFVGIFEYKPENKASAELSIRKGDRFRLVTNPAGAADPDWLFVRRAKHEEDRRWTGYVPKAYVFPDGSVDTYPWYFGEMTEREVEKLLKPLADSTFMVWKRQPVSTVAKGKKSAVKQPSSPKPTGPEKPQEEVNYVLSFKRKKKIYHRPIEVDGTLYTIPTPTMRVVQAYCYLHDLIEDLCDKPDMVVQHEIPGGLPLKGWPTRKPPGQVRAPLSQNSQQQWREIPRSEIVLGKRKGDGHFGVVYEATWKAPDGKAILVAVKELKKGSMRAKLKFLQEAITMKNLSHKHLVKLHGIVSDKEPFWLVTEYVKDGSLRDYLAKRKAANQLLSEKILIDLCAQICDGMRYLEEKKVVHRDLAARNILISELSPGKDPMLHAKVADFGLAQLSEQSKSKDSDEQKAQKTEVPTKWTAPEALQNNAYSTASDVWSFGIVLHEVFSHGQEPYGILLHPAVRVYVVQHRQILRQHATVPDKVYEVMKKCFNYDPKQRPSFKELYAFFISYYTKPAECTVSPCPKVPQKSP